jgi:pimeloyl-ACP methyl ester carboxylesterase
LVTSVSKRTPSAPSLLLTLVASTLLLACGDEVSTETATGAGGAGPSGAGGGPTSPLVWEACGNSDGDLGPTTECGRLQLPLLWDDARSRTIEVFVQRRLATRQPSTTQLWLLQGGPGAAGDGWAPYVDIIAAERDDVDFYVPDHRGVGRSTRLGCAAEAESSSDGANIAPGEWPACLDELATTWGEGLAGFSSEAASRDVAAYLELTREPDKHVVLYGASYGTTWGHRFLQLFTDRVDGVVLDSSNWPDRSYEDYDANWNGVAEELFATCGADTFCSSKLGTDPWLALQTVYEDLDGGHCPELVEIGFTPELMRPLLAYLVAYGELRPAALAVVYRVMRCSPADRQAVVNAFNVMFGPGGLLAFDDALFSPILSRHILQSEIGREPPSVAAQAFAESCTVCLGAGSLDNHDARWPRYAFDDDLLAWASSTTPLLAMNGGLDPFAPAERYLDEGGAEAFDAPHQRVLSFPLSAHGVALGTRTIDGDLPCGFRLALDFMGDPQADLDLACMDDLAPIDFTGSAIAEPLFATADAWE